ncbi:MAG: NAD(P)H-binding protein [Thermoplasmata archaeon]|nr:NAD(P)H-binding protein [Thermoplasmata archaeon]
MIPPSGAPRVLVVGGLGGLLGRALLPELTSRFRVRSFHRVSAPLEERAGVEWIAGDAAAPTDWGRILHQVDAVVNLAWYRHGSAGRFARLEEGLLRLIGAARSAGVGRFIQVSVPSAPPSLEARLPYLRHKRTVDQTLSGSGISYRVLRPTAMFGPGDVLLSAMMRAMARYPRFPMFGEGRYHLSPIAATDVAAAIGRELSRHESGTVDLGGPQNFEYRELTDLMFGMIGKPARYWDMSPRGGRRLALVLQSFGSSLLYAYEVDWLVSDMLGLPPYTGLSRPLRRVEPHLREVAEAISAARSSPGLGGGRRA